MEKQPTLKPNLETIKDILDRFQRADKTDTSPTGEFADLAEEAAGQIQLILDNNGQHEVRYRFDELHDITAEWESRVNKGGVQ